MATPYVFHLERSDKNFNCDEYGFDSYEPQPLEDICYLAIDHRYADHQSN
jgi:hypothetical protein